MESELEVLRDYIRSETGYAGEIGADVDLLEQKILDSFSVVQLALFLQDRFAIELDAEDLVRDNLTRLSRMVALIHRKRLGSAVAG